ncbi:MAG: hypothetical protein JSW47_09910 [Phycisphaerales bacterium]|nr:MAG: hypothetical protein JSW47_09910 [Phycisphaerales bacterium]
MFKKVLWFFLRWFVVSIVLLFLGALIAPLIHDGQLRKPGEKYINYLYLGSQILATGVIAGILTVKGKLPRTKTKSHQSMTPATCVVMGILICIDLFLNVHGSFHWRAWRKQNKADRWMRRDVGALAGAIDMYRLNHGEQYPRSLRDIPPSYFFRGVMPKLWYGGWYAHPVTDECLTLENKVVNDTGKWVYIYNPGHESHGSVYIDCNHVNSFGRQWYEYIVRAW